jgi:hypothetical protein
MPNGLQAVRSFALYYGCGGEKRLSAYDLVVISPEGRTADDLKRIRCRGTLALAYVSVLEVPQQSGQAPPPDVLLNAGIPQANAGFSNWILDPRSVAAQERVFGMAERLLALGYDGLFLDTMADLEDFPLTAALAAEVTPAAAWLVSELAVRYRCLLVQNRGFHRLLALTAPHLDGVCWEAFPYSRVGLVPGIHSGVRVLQDLQPSGLRVLALNESIRGRIAHGVAGLVAKRCGFLWYGTDRYTDLPPPKFLR